MSEYPVFNLILGLIGTVTGIVALFISYWTYRKEKPRLAVEVLGLTHNFTPREKSIEINFYLKFLLKNQGDRGTRINDIGVQFYSDKTEYSIKTRELNELMPNGGYKMGPKWLEAHDSSIIHANFEKVFEGDEIEKIDCIFTIFHTHGSYDFKFTSVHKRLPHLGEVMSRVEK